MKKVKKGASFKPFFTVQGLIFICAIFVLWDAKCLFKPNSTDHSHNSFTTLIPIHTHNIELFQLHLEQCACMEGDAHPSASLSCFDYSCMSTNACLFKHAVLSWVLYNFPLTHILQTYHTRRWPSHPEQLGLGVLLKGTLTCGQRDPRIKQTTLCFACHSNTLHNKGRAVLYLCRDYSVSVIIWLSVSW